MSQLEMSHTKTQQIYSSTIKMFIVQFTNTALIILLVNWNLASTYNLPTNFPILTGQYDNFSEDWY